MAKPTELPRWADVSGDIVIPTLGKKDAGWVDEEKPPAQFMNWLFHRGYLWDLYLQAGFFEGQFGLVSAIDAGSFAANQNNWSPTGLDGAVVVRFQNPGTDRTLSGIAGGASGRLLVLESTGSDDAVVELLHESGASTAANRIIVPGAESAVIADRGSAILMYDGAVSRWRLVGGHYSVPQTIYLGAAQGIAASGSPVLTLGSPTSRLYWATSASGQVVLFQLPVRVGDRIRSLRVHLQDASGASIQCRILRSSVTGGTQAGDTMVSDGSGTDQALAVTGLTGSAGKVGTSSPFWYVYAVTNDADAMEIYGVDLEVDRYLP